MVRVMKRGDRLPNLEATLTGRNEETGEVGPVDLSTATSVTAKGVQNGTLVIDREISGQADGDVILEWEPGETDAVGYIHFEFVVVWPDGRQQTFPEDGDVRVRISLDGG